jgi:hypothetical protein
MFSFYTGDKRVYWVAKDGEKVIGGAGIYPTDGLTNDTCEWRKTKYLNDLVQQMKLKRKSCLKDNCTENVPKGPYQQSNMIIQT